MAKDSILSQLKGTFGYVYNHIKAINDSKLFAGLIPGVFIPFELKDFKNELLNS